MSQTTFDDIRKRQTLEQLTDKQKRIIKLLAEGHTQSGTAKLMRVSRASVNTFTSFLEQNNLIKKQINTRYNILYEVAPALQRRVGGEVTEPLTACRVHSIALHFRITHQNNPVSKDKRTGYTRSWKLRGWEPSAFWFPGKAGEIACTVTTSPRSIVIRMDAGQKIIAKDVPDAEIKGFQHLMHIRQKFIDCQRKFGVILDIEPTGKRIGKVHGGFAGSASNPVMQEGVTVPGWWIDKSGKGELGEDKLELEAHTERGGPTRLDRMIMASEQFEHLPDLIKSSLSPIGQDVLQVKAMMQGEITMQRQYEQMMKWMTNALVEIQELRKEVQELKGR